MCVGDIHNIADEVKRFDPNYSLDLNPRLGKYQVFHHRMEKKEEGVLNGLPLYSFREVREITMTIEFIDAEKEPPDMRIIKELHRHDVWNYPGGPEAYYDDMMADDEKVKQERQEKFSDMVRYGARERHKYILRQHDNQDLKTLF